MTWLGIALGWAGKGAGRVWELVRAYPLYCVLIALLALQTARIEGIHIWFVGFDGLKSELATARQTIKDMTAKAKAARASSVTIAKESDKAHETRVADNRSATVRYIDNHRVRPQACPATSEVEDTRLPEATPAPAIVAVSEADVQICAANYSYALSAFEWAAKLREQGLAD